MLEVVRISVLFSYIHKWCVLELDDCVRIKTSSYSRFGSCGNFDVSFLALYS